MKKILFLLAFVFVIAGCGKDDDTSTTPVACFTYTAPGSTVFVGDPVEFSNCSTDADSFNWDFGDGSTSTEKNPTHTFETSKTFEVVLVAYGKGDHPKTDTTMVPITVWKIAK